MSSMQFGVFGTGAPDHLPFPPGSTPLGFPTPRQDGQRPRRRYLPKQKTLTHKPGEGRLARACVRK